MKTNFLIVFVVSLFSFSTVKSQEKIPFRLNEHYNILVDGLINQRDSVVLMFQIAMREASLASNRKTKVESVVFDTTDFPEGLSKDNRIQVGNIIVNKIWIWDKEYTGNGAEGKIGTQLFDGKIFAINFDQGQFELYDHLPDTSGFVALPLTHEQGRLFIEISSRLNEKEIKTKFLLQSGFSGMLLYNNQVGDDNQLAELLPRLDEKTLMNSAGEKLTNLIVEMPVVAVDSFRFTAVPVNVFTGEIKNQTTSYVGADFIHRFNWIIDIAGETAYIQQNKYFGDSYYFLKQ
ncbi:hypothetical protein [Myroides sp. WP-1]|uniref:hypothetical protein n=1 Tax=Myroides sp. WP-1 TaxID=2759944 RepID=UPI0015F8765F|nr:hypothetical protein [Myroides sp. WP-1]MBB1139147.1 hypothetical protein [Myroides sp. WP-1]